MTVGKKLSFAFYLIISIMLLATILNYHNLKAIDENQSYAFDHRIERILLIEDIKYDLSQQELYLRNYYLQQTPENKEKLATYTEKLQQNIAAFKESSSEQSIESAKQLEQYNIEYANVVDDAIRAIELDQHDIALSYLNGSLLQKASFKMAEITTEMSEGQQLGLQMTKETNSETISMSKRISFSTLIVGMLIGLVLVFIVHQKIVKPLRLVRENALYISDGDLTHADLDIQSKDEIGQLAQVFNEMKQHLRGLMVKVQHNADHLNDVAHELSTSVQEVASTTEEVQKQVDNSVIIANLSMQAAEESAHAMAETAQGVQQIAEASQVLHITSMNSNDVAIQGGEIIESAKGQMLVIENSTKLVSDLVNQLTKQIVEIESITHVITSISDQTNLLALNASIEAARAGEHGKGFAVVADEVKKLADESKQSAHAIGELTGTIQSETKNVEAVVSAAIHSVQDGVDVITKAGASFEHITNAVNEMTIQIQHISVTAEQLSASAEEVTASVNEIAIGSAKSANDIHSIAANMEEQTVTMQQVNDVAIRLADNAVELQHEVQQFKV